MDFKNYFNNYTEEKKDETPEAMFKDATGIELVDTLETFIAWMILQDKIHPTIKLPDRKRPISIFDLSDSKKILHLCKTISDIKKQADLFNTKWGKSK